MALNAKTDPTYVPKRINGKFAPGGCLETLAAPRLARGERLNANRDNPGNATPRLSVAVEPRSTR